MTTRPQGYACIHAKSRGHFHGFIVTVSPEIENVEWTDDCRSIIHLWLGSV